MLWWSNFGQKFGIFGLKSRKMAVFGIVLSARTITSCIISCMKYKIPGEIWRG